MITVTIGDYLAGKIDQAVGDDHCIYVFRNNGDVFYVGRSTDVLRRLDQHISPNSRLAASYMGDIVWENKPESFNWQIEIYTLEECLPVVQQYHPHFTKEMIMQETAEMCMIQHLHPCFNAQNNVHPGKRPGYVRMYQLKPGETDDLY